VSYAEKIESLIVERDTLRDQLAASEARAEWLAWTLRGMRCPRPCNTDPDDTTVAQCIALGHCGCGAALAELDAK